MHRHQPHLARGRIGLALQIRTFRLDPVQEGRQPRRLARLERDCLIEKLVDRVVRVRPQPGEQPLPPLKRARQDGVEKAIGPDGVGQPQHFAQPAPRLGRVGIAGSGKAKRCPQVTAPAGGEVVQRRLAPAQQRRDQKLRQSQIILGVGCEANQRQQVQHGDRLGQQQPVHPGNRHALGHQPADKRPHQP